MYGFVTKTQRFSVHDGPGIRTTVFLKGCPLSCVWCQNPETINKSNDVLYDPKYCAGCKKCIEVCPKGCFFGEDKEIKFKSDACDLCGICIDSCPTGALRWCSNKISADDVLKEVMRDKEFYDLSGGGLTISGGEPFNQIDFCFEVISKSRGIGINVAIDTSGYFPFEEINKFLPFVDVFLYDIKFFDSDLHLKYVGKPNKIVLDNFKALCEYNANIIVRIPIITGLTDSSENISKITEFVEGCRRGIEIEKIPFNNLMKEKYIMLGRVCKAGSY